MGVDVASVRALNVRISEHLDPLTTHGHRKRALFIGEVDSFKELGRLMSRYSVAFACIDHLPESRLAYGFAESFSGRVYVYHYASQQKDAISVDTPSRRVSVQRVPALDATIEVIRSQRNYLPGDLPAAYVEHMIAVRRKVEKDEYDRVTVVYESSGPDDYFQAEVYDLVATEVAKVRMEFEHHTREEVWQLDERLPFERSNLGTYGFPEYDPGPGGWDYFEFNGGDSE